MRQVSSCFSKAFQRFPKSMTNSLTGSDFNIGFNPTNDKVTSRVFIFEVTMDVKEEDGKGSYNAVPKDRNFFKLRSNVPKQICLSIQQVKECGITLEIERCFGILVSPGRNVKHSDMRLLEMQLTNAPLLTDNKSYYVSGKWDPSDSALESLNVETPREGKIFMTVAVDLVIRGIREPVRFVIETSVKIFSQNERFWYFNKRSLVQQFFLNSKEVSSY